MTEMTADTTNGTAMKGSTNSVQNLSQAAVTIAREIDRLPCGASAVYVMKGKAGIESVEIVTTDRLRYWRTNTEEIG